jgi:hypothetical protein
MWARRRCRRGSMYVAVLLTAMIVAVIGISALTITRVELRSAEGAKDTIEARFYAQSALEIGSHLINGDRNWRTAYSSGVWVAEQSIGTGTYAWKLVDEQDGDLANDPSQPVRLYGAATVHEAVRIYSVLLEPPMPKPDLLSNGDMESGTTDWYGCFCDIESVTTEQHSGQAALGARNRIDYYAGPAQDITGTIENGTTYELEAWVKMQSGASSMRFVMYVENTLFQGWWFTGGDTLVGDTEWTKVAAALTPTWTETLQKALVKIRTESGNDEFYVDDVILRVGPDVNLVVVGGTLRREVIP